MIGTKITFLFFSLILKSFQSNFCEKVLTSLMGCSSRQNDSDSETIQIIVFNDDAEEVNKRENQPLKLKNE